jgi:hypothetical protein
LKRRCPYHAKVINAFDSVSIMIVSKAFMPLEC